MTTTFEACAIFAGEDDSVEALRINFEEPIKKQISEELVRQLKVFENFERCLYDGRYKADDDECLSIVDYKDPGNVIGVFKKYLNGESSDTLSSVDDLTRCRAFLFVVPEYPEKVLIQRFSRVLIANKGRFYSISDNDTFSSIKESAVTIASSLAGLYDLRTNVMDFTSVQTIRSAIPGFDDVYAPGADESMIQGFFSDSIFEESSAKEAAKKDSTKIARLIWLINDSKVNLKQKLTNLQKIDELLNMNCYLDGGKVKFPSDVKRACVLLRVFLDDVFIQDGNVYLTNSKRALSRFN